MSLNLFAVVLREDLGCERCGKSMIFEIVFQSISEGFYHLLKKIKSAFKTDKSFFWLYMLAAIWYGGALVFLVLLPFIWMQETGGQRTENGSFFAFVEALVFLPFFLSAFIFLFTAKDFIKRKNGAGLLTGLNVLSLFLAPLFFVFYDFTRGKFYKIWDMREGFSSFIMEPETMDKTLQYFSGTTIGAIAGVLTFGLLFPSFSPVLSTFLGSKIMGKQDPVGFLRLSVIFLLCLFSWIVVTFTGFLLGKA